MADCVTSLTAAIASGNTEAFARFYDAWFDELYAYARRASGRDEAFCLDLVQDVMMKVIKRLRPMPTEQALRLWLRRVVVSTMIDTLRSEKRRAARESRYAESRAGQDAPAMADAERLGWLTNELASMDDALADLMVARHRFGWTLSRIGEVFGLTPGLVDGRTRREAERLRRRAAEVFDD